MTTGSVTRDDAEYYDPNNIGGFRVTVSVLPRDGGYSPLAELVTHANTGLSVSVFKPKGDDDPDYAVQGADTHSTAIDRDGILMVLAGILAEAGRATARAMDYMAAKRDDRNMTDAEDRVRSLMRDVLHFNGDDDAGDSIDEQ